MSVSISASFFRGETDGIFKKTTSFEFQMMQGSAHFSDWSSSMGFVGVKRACSGVRISISISNLLCRKDYTGDHRLRHSMVLFSLCGHSLHRIRVRKSVSMVPERLLEPNNFQYTLRYSDFCAQGWSQADGSSCRSSALAFFPSSPCSSWLPCACIEQLQLPVKVFRWALWDKLATMEDANGTYTAWVRTRVSSVLLFQLSCRHR